MCIDGPERVSAESKSRQLKAEPKVDTTLMHMNEQGAHTFRWNESTPRQAHE